MATPSGLDLSTGGTITAVLGPTNTGKTHVAIQRMLAHRTGMIGLPLRLLAREVYDRVVREKGADQVALLTGEEKRVPRDARYWVCTVESMPVDKPVGFLAVDEIQLAGDPARGHAFTDRLLRARGVGETWFLGSETIAPLLAQLVPTAQIRTQPRLSNLSYAGPRKVTGLPPRSAVVAFSARRVYELAERLRARHGGVAVVLGALSPRTRNAQVAMFEAGEVEHLVATDAIGMGLNLDVHHIALAGAEKFDGRGTRPLRADELAQIAGRAGRHRRDGTFGETAGLDPLDPGLVDAIEQHQFEPLARLYWRSADLCFDTVGALRDSLVVPAPRRCLIAVRDADDAQVLDAVVRSPAVLSRAKRPDAIRLLWEVCGIPDFADVLPEHHGALVEAIFVHLVDNGGELPEDWFAAQIKRLDRTEGDVDALTSRLAAVRTWTYVSNRAGWLKDGRGWQARVRDLEERLSDALHTQLTARFVDRRLGVVVSRDGVVMPTVRRAGDTLVSSNGEVVGGLRGFHVDVDARPGSHLDRAVRAAVTPWLLEQVTGLEAAPDTEILLGLDGTLRWQDVALATLTAGPDWRRPTLRIPRTDLLEGAARARLVGRLERWLAAWLGSWAIVSSPDLTAPERALRHALHERLGLTPRVAWSSALRELGPDALARLERDGVVVGEVTVQHAPSVARVVERALLWRVHHGAVPDVAASTLAVRADWAQDVTVALGFVPVGRWRIRADALEWMLAGGPSAAASWGISEGAWAAVAQRWRAAPNGRARR